MITPFGEMPDNIYWGIMLSLITSVVAAPLLMIYSKFFRGNTIHIKIMKNYGGVYKQIKKIKVSANKTDFKYGEKSYPIEYKKGILINNELNIFYDADNSSALNIIKGEKVTMSPETYQQVFKSKIHDLIFEGGAMDDWMGILLIIGVVASLLVGIYSLYMINELSDKIIVIINNLPRVK